MGRRRVLDRATKDLVSKRSRIALSQKYESHNIGHRIHVRPMKIYVGDASRCSLQVNEQRGNRVGNHCALGMQDTTRTFPSPMDSKMVGEVRSVAAFYFEEEDGIVRGKTVETSKLEVCFVAVLFERQCAGSMR